MPSVDHTLEIAADPGAILGAFFDPAALGRWWRVQRSVTTPRILGVYAIEWPPTPFVDEVFGPLGGVLHGTVVDYRPDREFLVAEVHWLPPAGEPVGPMALHVSAIRQAGATVTRLRVLQTGGDDTPRWSRYYELMANGWTGSLAALKDDVEQAAKAEAAGTPGQATR
jgi:uncharacterized protein YndB with AHSA1/START domain